MGAAIPNPRNVEIFGEDEPAEYLYQVVRGAVRTYKLLSDGRRQIGAFYLPGDVFGLEAGVRHRLTAEAVSDSIVLVVKRKAVIALAARDANFAQELWAITARALEQVQGLMLTLGRRTAQERVAGFLLEMAARGRDHETVELPMSRQDIADHLGLTIETVSRTISQLEEASAIDLPNSRRIVLRDRNALARLSG
jgi:CRP/FNR family transcriptional regulator, nitrogen fixation regulation protein